MKNTEDYPPDKIAFTSTLTGKTPEGLPRDEYPNSFLPYTEEEILRGQCGGRAWFDWIPRPRKKNNRYSAESIH